MNASDLWKPTSGAFISNPFPTYEKLRQYGPVFKAATGDYVMIGFEACKAILQDPSCNTGLRRDWVLKMNAYADQKGMDFSTLEQSISGMLIQLNGPLHSAIRGRLAKAWPSPNTIKSLAANICTSILDELEESFEAIEIICKRLPLQMICSLLGLPEKEGLNYMNDGLRLVQLLDPYLSYQELVAIHKSSIRLNSFIEENISSRKVESELTKTILALGEEKKQEIDPVAIITFLFIAGFETTSTLLATCLYQLVKNKNYLSEIEEHGSQNFVREMLRIYSPVQITGRKTAKEIQINDTIIPTNSSLTLCLGAANLDPSYFRSPKQINWGKEKTEHLSFGYGLHHCLGSQLAELEASTLIESMLPILPTIELIKEPTFEKKLTIRSFQSLQLKRT